MKTLFFGLSFIILCMTTVFAAQPAYALESGTYYVLHEGTAIYAEQNFDSIILKSLDKDTEIEVIGTENVENTDWCMVVIEDCTGYVPTYNLYTKTFSQSFRTRYAKITADKNGEDIFLYDLPSYDAQKLTKLNDGNRVLLTGTASGDFLEVEHNGVRGYVVVAYVTHGLTYHQYLALVVGIVCFIAIAAVVVLAYHNRNKKN